jgi:ABC-type enterobactin transport system permease subunit
MGAVAFVLVARLETASHLWQVVVPSVAAGIVYAVLLWLLRVQEAQRLWQMVRSRVRKA